MSGPVYRAVLDVRAPAPPADDGDPVVEVVPDELTVLFRRDLGVDVSAIPVHRGRSVSRQAAALGARAFARGGDVFLPGSAGSLTARPVRALLAHELAHAVQQRVLGAAQPSPESADGRELEDAALAVEDWVAGHGSAPGSLVHRPAGAAAPGALPADVTQLSGAAEPDDRPPSSWTLGGGFGAGLAATAEPEQQAGAVAAAFQQIADLRESVAGLRARQDAPAEPHTLDLGEVAGRLYEYVRTRLRAELIIDRERAGLLADFG